MIEKYIPSGEYGAKVAGILKPYENDLYAIGSNGRNQAYSLKSLVGGYDFVLDQQDAGVAEKRIYERLTEIFPGKVTIDGATKAVQCDCETFFLKIRVQPLGQFLRQVIFAGDMLAVSVKDGSLIVCPEFMTVPPMIQVRKVEDTDAQNNTEWQKNHQITLKKFHDDIVAEITKGLKTDEPAKA